MSVWAGHGDMGDNSGSPCNGVEGDRRVSAYGVKRRAGNSHLTWLTKLTVAHHPCSTKEKKVSEGRVVGHSDGK